MVRNSLHAVYRQLLSWRMFAFAAVVIWLNTYLVQRFYFNLPITSWYQELMMAINPIASTLLWLGLGALIFRRWQHWVILAVSFLVSATLFADVLYFRFYNDFITLPVLFMKSNAKGLGSSVWTLISWKDIFIFTGFILLTVLVLTKKLPRVNLSRPQLLTLFTTLVVMFYGTWMMAEAERPQLLTRSFDRQLIVKNIGTMNYHLYDLFINSQMESKRAFASSSDADGAAQYLANKPKDHSPLFGIAKGKNVFMIHLESFQGFLIGSKVNGQEVTPFLNSLTHNSYYFDNLFHQTGQGKTSDAEFMLENSLYGLPSGAVFFTHASNTYYSTADILHKYGYYSASFHANDKTFWNRDNMYQTLGFDRFISKEDFHVTDDNSVGWGLRDIDFFDQSLPYLKQLPQPFYTKLITITNHFPYEYNDSIKMIDPYNSGDKSFDDYFVTARYLDEAVKHLFDELKQAGLYDNSIFILYGDHYGISNNHNRAMSQFLGKEITPVEQAQLQRVPLFIVIPGQKGKVMHTVGGQIDVRPTLLHLLGVKDGDNLSFGHDLFDPNRQQFAVFRDGSFVTDKYVYTEEKCFVKATGEEVDASACQPYMDRAKNDLTYSDDIVYGDLLRFILNKDGTTNTPIGAKVKQ